MTYSAVDIRLRENNTIGAPIKGCTVKVLSEDGKLVYGQAESGDDGVVSFLLAVRNYQVRFYKFGVDFKNPMRLELDDAPENVFAVFGVPHVPPVSTDPRICLCSGFFRTASGAAQKNLDIHFMPKFDPLLVDGVGILDERVITRTDDKGYAVVPLFRCAEFDVTIQGMENWFRSIEVPDRASVNLPDLLFPGIQGVSFDELASTTAITMGRGTELLLHGHVLTTDLRELDELGSDVAWSLSNPMVLDFEMLPGSILKLRALKPGYSEVRGEPRDKTVIRIPNLPIAGLPLQVTIV